jgi:hypothetical protein
VGGLHPRYVLDLGKDRVIRDRHSKVISANYKLITIFERHRLVANVLVVDESPL